MAKPVQLHPEPHLRGRHFIVEWADKAGLTQADISRAMDVDKSVVSRWFSGKVPRPQALSDLAIVLGAEEALSLFRHPDDDWMARFLRGRDADEKRRIMQTLETAFPRKIA